MDESSVIYKNKKPKKVRNISQGNAEKKRKTPASIVMWEISIFIAAYIALGAIMMEATSIKEKAYEWLKPMLITTYVIYLIHLITCLILSICRKGKIYMIVSHIIITTLSLMAVIFEIIIAIIFSSKGDDYYTIISGSYAGVAIIYAVIFAIYLMLSIYFTKSKSAAYWFRKNSKKTEAGPSQEATVRIICNNCSKQVDKTMKYCPNCGSEIKW